MILPGVKFEGFVIINPDTGLYSSGGSYIRWRKKPKIWSAKAHLSNHVNLHMHYYTKLSRDNYYGSYKGHELICDITNGNVLSTVNEKRFELAKKYMEKKIKRYTQYNNTSHINAAKERLNKINEFYTQVTPSATNGE